jgi:hypothetical protein
MLLSLTSLKATEHLTKGVTVMTARERTRHVAEEAFKKKERQRLDGLKAMSEHEAASRAEMAKTARLRALRLARDAAQEAAPAKPKAPKPTALRSARTRLRDGCGRAKGAEIQDDLGLAASQA